MTKELQDLAWRCLPREFKEEVKKEWGLTDNAERLPHDAFLRAKYTKWLKANVVKDVRSTTMIFIVRFVGNFANQKIASSATLPS